MDASQHIYEFGPFRIDTVKRLLWREGQLVQLTSKGFDTLLVLIEQRGQVVAKDDLMKALWPDTVVEENNLTQQISMLRKALGERVNDHRYVVTVPGRGYCFVAEVVVENNCGVEISNPPEVRWPVASNSWKSRIILTTCLSLAALTLLAFGISWRRARSTKERVPNRSIAVLPFKSISNDPANIYLSMGMADALITKLSNLRQISVRPTSAIMKYAEQQASAQTVGRELGVDSVLEGTVQKAGQHVRVTVQLVNVHDEAPLWAQTFDQEMTDIFAVQDAISEQVARSMMITLNGDDQKQLRKRPTENVAAYQEYLEGRYFWNTRNKDGLTKSVGRFQRAIDLDEKYAQAYSGLADAYIVLVSYRIESIDPDEGIRKARDAATKALAIDDSLADAHASLAMIRTRYDRDDAGAEVEFKRAIQLNPNYATAHHWYSEYLARCGRETEALMEIKLAQEIDPLSPVINTTLGERLYFERRYDEAIGHMRKTLEFSPNFASAHFLLGLALEQKEMFEEAISEFQKANDITGVSQAANASLGHIYALAGRPREARRVLHELLARKTSEPYEIALVYQGLREKKQVLDWLEKIEHEEVESNMMLRLDPRLDDLRSDPRFQKLLRRGHGGETG
jgi:TolB-like protein/DNA-binding winged helix-turn-helix (wHTH) protein/Flp pilus assembly protein TadD